MIEITTAATDLQLLSIAEMRAAAGVTGTASDAELKALGLRISASIAAECNVSAGSGLGPTFRRETLTETLRLQTSRAAIVLSRRHDIEIESVAEDGTVLDTANYEVDGEAGLLYRLVNDCATDWCGRKLVIVYAAGFDTVPGDLKQAAIDFFRSSYLERERDPLVKAEETDVPGVLRERREYWVGSVPGTSQAGAVPGAVAGQLSRFRNNLIG